MTRKSAPPPMPAAVSSRSHGRKMRAFPASCAHSAASARLATFAAPGFATTTSQSPSRNIGRERRTISRSLLLTRLRTTAPPSRREVTIPVRVAPHVPVSNTPISISRPCTDRPSSRTRANSEARASRATFGKRRRGVRPSGRPSAASCFAGGCKIRPAYAARNEPRHLLGEGACGHAGGGGRASRARSWSSCARGSRTAACGCAWMLGRCVLAWLLSQLKKGAQNSGRAPLVNGGGGKSFRVIGVWQIWSAPALWRFVEGGGAGVGER